MKKLLSTLIAVVMVLSMLPAMVNAQVTACEIITLSGETPAYGETLKANVTGGDGVTYQWQRVDSTNLATDITGANAETYIVTEEDAGYSLQVVATDADSSVTSSKVAIKSYIKSAYQGFYTVNKNPNPDNVFTLDGTYFYTLANSFNNVESKYFIVANQVQGSYYINTKSMIPQNAAGNLTHHLNNSDIAGIGNDFKKYINNNHIWITEASGPSTYSYSAGITIPSVSEMVKYGDTIGWYVGEVQYQTRTQYTSTKDYLLNINLNGNDTQMKTNVWGIPFTLNIRPVFYLKDGFFGNVAVDLKSAGTAVKNEIKRYDYETLSNLYSDADLYKYLGVKNPEAPFIIEKAEIVALSGNTPAYGETVKAEFEYSDVNDYELSSYTINWKNSDSDTVLATGDTYIVTEADTGKNLYYEIEITDANGTTGTVKSSEYAIASIISIDPLTVWQWVTVNQTTPPENVFVFNGKSFSIADVLNNEKFKYFVVANDIYGDRKRTADDIYLTKESGLGKYLNTDLPNHTNADYKFADEIKEHIDWTHKWMVESAPKATIPIEKAYSYEAGVSILSANELKRYGTKIGYDLGVAAYMLRSPVNWENANHNGHYAVVRKDQEVGGLALAQWEYGSATNIRPVFYLDGDFFKEVEIDLSKAGTNVLAEIKKLDYSTLIELYTASELKTYLELDPPEGYVAINDLAISARSGAEPAYGDTISVSFEYDTALNENAMADYSVVWKNTDGITLGTQKTYVVKETDAGKTIYAEVTVKDSADNAYMHESDGVLIPAFDLSGKGANYIAKIKKTVSEDDVFTLDGQEFTLVKAFDNEESTYFVAANQTYGTYRAESNILDPTNASNMQYWLANDFPEDGNNGYFLPEDIVKNIDYNHVWVTEGASAAATPIESYSFKAGITIPSASEMDRYGDVMSYDIGAVYYTRTTANYKAEGSEACFLLVSDSRVGGNTETQALLPHWNATTNPAATGIRPVFYLKKDFFTTTKLDLTTVGTNVLSLMAEKYSIEELAHLYDAEILEEMGFVYDTEIATTFTKYNSDEELYELNGATSLQANVAVTNNADDAFEATIYLAIYDGSDNLVAVKSANASVASGESKTVTAGFETLSGIGAGHVAKLMIWKASQTPVRKVNVLNTVVESTATTASFSSENRGNNFFEASQL